MQNATHYIEVFKSGTRPVLVNSARPIPIEKLEKNLAATRQALVLETFFVWKIKEKPSAKLTVVDEINDCRILIIEEIKP